MYGAQNDVLGFTIGRAAPGSLPENRFVTQNNFLGLVDVQLSNNQHERLASQRTIPFKAINNPQSHLVSIINQEHQVFANGGLAFIPNAGLWRGR
jgi:hypothetical protein